MALVAPSGNQAANRENKPQPVLSGETSLLDSKKFLSRECEVKDILPTELPALQLRELHCRFQNQ